MPRLACTRPHCTVCVAQRHGGIGGNFWCFHYPCSTAYSCCDPRYAVGSGGWAVGETGCTCLFQCNFEFEFSPARELPHSPSCHSEAWAVNIEVHPTERVATPPLGGSGASVSLRLSTPCKRRYAVTPPRCGLEQDCQTTPCSFAACTAELQQYNLASVHSRREAPTAEAEPGRPSLAKSSTRAVSGGGHVSLWRCSIPPPPLLPVLWSLSTRFFSTQRCAGHRRGGESEGVPSRI